MCICLVTAHQEVCVQARQNSLDINPKHYCLLKDEIFLMIVSVVIRHTQTANNHAICQYMRWRQDFVSFTTENSIEKNQLPTTPQERGFEISMDWHLKGSLNP